MKLIRIIILVFAVVLSTSNFATNTEFDTFQEKVENDNMEKQTTIDAQKVFGYISMAWPGVRLLFQVAIVKMLTLQPECYASQSIAFFLYVSTTTLAGRLMAMILTNIKIGDILADIEDELEDLPKNGTINVSNLYGYLEDEYETYHAYAITQVALDTIEVAMSSLGAFIAWVDLGKDNTVCIAQPKKV